MSITIRRVKFEFPDDLDDVFPGDDVIGECAQVAFSLTMPHLEPYLIRVFRSVSGSITDPQLKSDVDAFIGQEAQHHRNHQRINEIVKARLDPAVAAQLQTIEDKLEADYRRFSAGKSMRFNLAYAEGFEAMTCAWANDTMNSAGEPGGAPTRFGVWQQLWAWHAAEEIEHRTVAFDLYDHLCGSYVYRVFGSARAQRHFLGYISCLQRILVVSQGLPDRKHPSQLVRTASYRNTFRPGYNPRNLTISPLVELILAGFGQSAPGHTSDPAIEPES